MKLRVAVSAIRLGLSVAAQRLGVIATAIRLGLAVPAMKLQTAVGQFLRFLSFTDTVSSTSSAQIETQKPFTDSGRVVETKVEIELRKSFSDGAGSDDDAQYFFGDYVVGAPGGQTYTIPKQVVLNLSKPRSDQFSAAESSRFLFATGRVDSFRASDIRGGFLVIKALQEGVTVNDELSGTGSGLLFKGFNTVPRALDLHSVLLQRAVGDTARALDARTLVGGKAVGDTPRATDLRSLTSSKVFGDTSRASEATVFLVGRALADTSRARDSGIVLTQNYVDSSTYFAEDYVGNATQAFAVLLQRLVGDTTRALDARALLSGKVLVDIPRATDLRSLTSIKVFGDTPRVSEVDVLRVSKSLAETPRTLDSGAIFTQDYVDSSTYFAEAYVANVSRTF